jgi:K+ transporter
MQITFKTISQRNKTMWITLFSIILISIALLFLLPSTHYKLISIGCSLAVISSAIVFVLFTKTEEQTFLTEQSKKKRIDANLLIRPFLLLIFSVVLFFLTDFLI